MSGPELLHLVLASAHVGVLVLALRSRRRAVLAAGILAAIAAALAYDNLVLALGGVLGPGETLLGLNAGRFLLHAVLTPVILIAALELAAARGVAWAGRRGVRIAAALAVALMVAAGVVEFVGLELEAATEAGIVRYRDADAAPPIAAIVAVLVAIAAGNAIRRRTSSSALLAGSVVMFIGSAADPALPTLLVGNTAEVLFLVGILVTLRADPNAGSVHPPSPSRGVARVTQS